MLMTLPPQDSDGRTYACVLDGVVEQERLTFIAWADRIARQLGVLKAALEGKAEMTGSFLKCRVWVLTLLEWAYCPSRPAPLP